MGSEINFFIEAVWWRKARHDTKQIAKNGKKLWFQSASEKKIEERKKEDKKDKRKFWKRKKKIPGWIFTENHEKVVLKVP